STQLLEIPHNKVGLVLGANKTTANGYINLYYKYRIVAAKTLYDAGKVEYLLVSGDNGTKGYDEPTSMRNDLIAMGVPANKIYCDYAGFRTLDSVVRSKKVFGQSKITIVSQQFHNERALFLAAQHDIEAVAYNAQDVHVKYAIKSKSRELLARVKLLIDIILGTQPKYIGEPVPII
ncbi:MAG: ElyC/SanA/YdcF family protein, partial [Bacteroidota bacterium]